MITFGYPFDQLTLSSHSADQTDAERRIAFLAILIHEATHVRDQKAGRFGARTKYKPCVDAERSGLSKQLQFERDLLADPPSDNTVEMEEYRVWLESLVSTETKALGARETWLAYCEDLLDTN